MLPLEPTAKGRAQHLRRVLMRCIEMFRWDGRSKCKSSSATLHYSYRSALIASILNWTFNSGLFFQKSIKAYVQVYAGFAYRVRPESVINFNHYRRGDY